MGEGCAEEEGGEEGLIVVNCGLGYLCSYGVMTVLLSLKDYPK